MCNNDNNTELAKVFRERLQVAREAVTPISSIQPEPVEMGHDIAINLLRERRDSLNKPRKLSIPSEKTISELAHKMAVNERLNNFISTILISHMKYVDSKNEEQPLPATVVYHLCDMV